MSLPNWKTYVDVPRLLDMRQVITEVREDMVEAIMEICDGHKDCTVKYDCVTEIIMGIRALMPKETSDG